MDFGFENFESGFSDFDVEVEEVEVRKVAKYSRVFTVGRGGSICLHNSHGRYVYFGAMDCHFYKVDCVTGEEMWRFRTGDIILGKPSDVHNGKIYFGSYDQNIYCLDFRTGKELWRFRTNGKMATNSVAIHEEKLYMGNQSGTFYCLDIETGKEIWRFRTGEEICSTAGFAEGKIFIGSFDSCMYCLDKKTGKEIWRFKTGGEIQVDIPPAVKDGVIYFTSFDSYLYAVNVETGKEIWRFKTGKYGNSASPVLHDNVLYQGSREGYFFAISLEGREIWRFKAGENVVGMGIQGDRIYFGSEDGNLYCVSIQSGEEIWRFRAGGPVFDFPTFYEGKIYVGSWDCKFYCIDGDGKMIWSFNTSSQSPSHVGKPHGTFKMEVKHETHFDDTKTDDKYKKKKEEIISLSDYHVTSEYATTSEYKQKSDYDVNLVMFEGVLEGEELWTSDLKISSPGSRISMPS